MSATVQPDGWGWGSSFAGQCCFWVIVSGSGFFCLIKVADGLRIWQSLPGWASWKRGSWLPGAPQPGSSTLLPPSGLADSWRAGPASEPSSGTASTRICSAAPFHPTASLTLPGGPLPPEAGGQEASLLGTVIRGRGGAESQGRGRKGLRALPAGAGRPAGILAP